MKTNFKLLVFLFISVFLFSTVQVEAQSLKQLREKAKKEAQKKLDAKKKKNNSNSNSSSTTSSSSSTKSTAKYPEKEDAKAMWPEWQKITEASKNWPHEVHKNTFAPTLLEQIEYSNANFEKEVANLKAKYPKILVFYGSESGKPDAVEYGGNDDSFPYSQIDWINSAIMKHYIWVEGVKSSPEIANKLCQVVQDRIIKAEQAPNAEKIEKATRALRLAKAVKFIISPDNMMIGDLIKNAEGMLDKSFDDVRHLLTGKMHKVHYKKIVAYSKPQVIGKEVEAELITEITPGKTFFMTMYFADKLYELNSNVGLNGVKVTGPPRLSWKMVSSDGIQQTQQLYWNVAMLDKIKDQTYYTFDLFPKVEEINFESHLEYIPILNTVKWLTYQMPGKYQIEFYCGPSYTKTVEGVFDINLTKESIADLKKYYDALKAKKLEAVTFNSEYGCDNSSTAQLGGLEHMKKHGEIIRFTIAQTGQVMKPWPNESQVNNYVGSGWGVFKHSDGRYEIISLGFSRAASSNLWSFTTCNKSDDFDQTGDIQIHPEVIKLGYEILEKNINVCKKW